MGAVIMSCLTSGGDSKDESLFMRPGDSQDSCEASLCPQLFCLRPENYNISLRNMITNAIEYCLDQKISKEIIRTVKLLSNFL